MASTPAGEMVVGIFIPAFAYPSSMPYQAIVNAAMEEMGLTEDSCGFLKLDNDSIACTIKNTKFTLQDVERWHKQNLNLSEQLQRAGDALVAFQEKIEADELTIDNLKAQLMAMRSEENDENTWKIKYEEEAALRMALQEKLEKLKHVVNSDTILNHTEQNKPKIPRLQLPAMNGIPHTEPVAPRQHTPTTTSRNGLVTSPREFRNGPIDTHAHTQDVNAQALRCLISPRDTHIHAQDVNAQALRCLISPRDTHIHAQDVNAQVLRGLSSPRDTHGYMQVNGKRSSTEMTSPRASKLGLPNGLVSDSITGSPRSTSSPRAAGVVQMKAHARRHSANLEESVPVRRLSGNLDLGATPRSASPRSKSSSEIPPNYFDYSHQFPDIHSLMPVVHSVSSPALDSVGSKKRNTISNLKSSRSEMDFPVDALGQCRLCNCEVFRVDGKADWICTCGHTNIKHSVSYLKRYLKNESSTIGSG